LVKFGAMNSVFAPQKMQWDGAGICKLILDDRLWCAVEQNSSNWKAEQAGSQHCKMLRTNFQPKIPTESYVGPTFLYTKIRGAIRGDFECPSQNFYLVKMLCAACGIEIERFTADPRKCAYGSYGDSCDWASACCNCAKKKGWTMQPCRICQTRADKDLAPST
jgi:hypothetical protein